MTIFGLTGERVHDLLQPLSLPDEDDGNPAERVARAAWTTIAEPGDGVAGWLTSSLGGEQALIAVIESHSPQRIVAAIQLTGQSVPDDAPAMLQAAQQRWQPRVASGTAILAMQQAARVGARLLVPGDRGWPDALGDLGVHAPIALWWRGRREALDAFGTSIALVGARAATTYGEHVAIEASAGLVDRGFAIVSGAAYGIDGMAHRSALAGRGTTMAFLAGGVDRFYPTGHDALLGKIVDTGLVLSELSCGSAPTRWRFLQRNRLIAASSLATMVLEAGWRSGSLNTAAHASALGRPLGAVPGPVTSAASAGCHRLLREFAAVCVTNASEMAELAGAGVGDCAPDLMSELDGARNPEETRVIDALSTRSPRSLADLCRRAGLSMDVVQAVIGTLDLEGAVREKEDGWLILPKR